MPAKKIRCKDALHRYRRFVNANGKEQWKCADCPSYTYNRADLVGNKARCFFCGVEFTLSPEKLTYAKPKCGDSLQECRAALLSPTVDMLSLYRESLEELARERAGDSALLDDESRSEPEQEDGESLLRAMMKEGK